MSRKELSPLQAALRYLSFRARTECEVRRKLETSGFSDEQIHTTLETLKLYKYVNDEALARDWARDHALRRGCGPLWVAQELSRRGVETPLLERIIAEAFGPGEELERARQCIEKHFDRKSLSSLKVLKRAHALLARRGYNPSVIEEALSPYFEEVSTAG